MKKPPMLSAGFSNSALMVTNQARLREYSQMTEYLSLRLMQNVRDIHQAVHTRSLSDGARKMLRIFLKKRNISVTL